MFGANRCTFWRDVAELEQRRVEWLVGAASTALPICASECGDEHDDFDEEADLTFACQVDGMESRLSGVVG